MCSRYQEHNFAGMGLSKFLRMIGVMDQDVKSNNLDVHLGRMEFTSGPFGDQKGNNSTCLHMFSNKVCNCSINCQRARKSNVCARLLNTSSYSTDTVCIERTGQCMNEVKPCETWMCFAHEVKLVTCGILAKSVSSGCASALQAQHPHMVPLELELPRLCVVLATTRAYQKSRI